VIGRATQRCGKDSRREDADAVGTEVLEKPKDRSENRGTPVALVEQRHE
jgi:hypothetical protein